MLCLQPLLGVLTILNTGRHNSRLFKQKQGGFYVRGTDETFQFKALHYEKDIESFALNFETQNQAPFDALNYCEICYVAIEYLCWRLACAGTTISGLDGTDFQSEKTDRNAGMGFRNRFGCYLPRS